MTKTMKVVAALLVLLLAVGALVAAPAAVGESNSPKALGSKPTPAITVVGTEAADAIALGEWVAAQDAAAVQAYLDAVHQAEVAAAQSAVRQQFATSNRSGTVCGDDWDCFRECTIDHESRTSGMYDTNTGNGYFGAFQFAQSTWDSVAANAGYGEWVGRPASDAPPAVQDAVARFLWEHSGNRPWGGRC